MFSINFALMKRCTIIHFLLVLSVSSIVNAQEFTETRTYKNSFGGAKSEIEYPVDGEYVVLRTVRYWIGEQMTRLGNRPEGMDDFQSVALAHCKSLPGSRPYFNIHREYEDERVCTFLLEANVDDTLRHAVVMVSKIDGHMFTPSEMFSCDEAKMKELMLEWKGKNNVESTDDILTVKQSAMMDGWVIMIADTKETVDAEFRVRFSSAEPFMNLPDDI